MQVWMSHGDAVKEAPKDFVVIGKTNTAPFAAIAHVEKPIYGIQFHAEVTHSHRGKEVIGRFVKDICQCSGEWTMVSSLVNTRTNLLTEILGIIYFKGNFKNS